MIAQNERGAAPIGARVERFRRAERGLWDRFELRPRERFIEIGASRTRLRVLEVGSGDPAVFVHGSGPPGAASVWTPLVAELPGLRCLMIDLPGNGLSAPLTDAGDDYPTRMAEVLDEVMTAVDIEQAHVVSWSIGGIWALRLALRRPDKVRRMVQMGFSPIWDDLRPPATIRLQSTPVGAAMLRLPVSPPIVRRLLRSAVGHGASLDAGRIPDEMIDWIVALMRHTDTMANDRAWLRQLVNWHGARPGLGFHPNELSAVRGPMLFVHGTNDWPGTAVVADRTVAAIPDSKAHVVRDGGHVPWLDDAHGVGAAVRAFLGGA